MSIVAKRLDGCHHQAALAADPRSDIHYKLCLLDHRALNGQSPNYVAELLYTARHHKTLKPAVSRQERPPRSTNITEVWERACSVAGPAAWNSLPTDIQTTTSSSVVKKKL